MIVAWLLFMVPAVVFANTEPLLAMSGLLLAIPFLLVVFGIASYRARERAKRVAACRTSRGRVTEILDGSLVAAAKLETDIPSEPFVARFALVTPDGTRIVVEPGPTRLIDLTEIQVGDEIQIQGPTKSEAEAPTETPKPWCTKERKPVLERCTAGSNSRLD